MGIVEIQQDLRNNPKDLPVRIHLLDAFGGGFKSLIQVYPAVGFVVVLFFDYFFDLLQHLESSFAIHF